MNVHVCFLSNDHVQDGQTPHPPWTNTIKKEYIIHLLEILATHSCYWDGLTGTFPPKNNKYT